MKVLLELGFRQARPDEIARLAHVVYAVTNGDDILQIGKGSGDRASRCMKGSLAAKHNKAFICAVYPTVSKVDNQYFVLPVDDRASAAERETQVHKAFGIATNDDAACVLSKFPGRHSIEDVHAHVIGRVRDTSAYLKSLTPGERHLAEQLFDMMAFGRTSVRRSSGAAVTSVQGDNLEGNILVACRRNHLIPVFLKLSGDYLRYGVHRPNNEFMQRLFTTSFKYTPKEEAFVINGNSQWSRIDTPTGDLDLAAMGLEPA